MRCLWGWWVHEASARSFMYPPSGGMDADTKAGRAYAFEKNDSPQ
jgi:hypothetical protein